MDLVCEALKIALPGATDIQLEKALDEWKEDSLRQREDSEKPVWYPRNPCLLKLGNYFDYIEIDVLIYGYFDNQKN